MKEEVICKVLHNTLFREGYCKRDVWFDVVITCVDTGESVRLDALCPLRGNIRVRKPIKPVKEDRVLYEVFRCSRYNKLESQGFCEYTVSEVRPVLRGYFFK